MPLLEKANEGKEIKRKTPFGVFSRFPYKTHLIHIMEDPTPFFMDIKKNHYKEGDFVAVSEKFIAISEGRVIHRSLIKPSLLAKILVKGVKKYKNDTGYSNPLKMQVAIMRAGYIRIFLAAVLGAITRLFGRHGDFYRIAGNRISEIDGFDPATVKPFDEFAVLGPEDPNRAAQKIEDEVGIPAVILDSNNINTEVLGRSNSVSYSDAEIREIFLDNPMSQGSELTPIILVRKESD